jgi:hypothetical protein
MTEYRIENGTAYHIDTPIRVIEILEKARQNRTRIRIWYGKNGHCWNDEFGTIGTVGRSTGQYKIPLLIKNRRSIGGAAILDDCIVRIDVNYGRGKIVTVYTDDSIKFDKFISTDLGNVYNETKDKLYARCKNGDSGKRLADFMNGKRWSK